MHFSKTQHNSCYFEKFGGKFNSYARSLLSKRLKPGGTTLSICSFGLYFLHPGDGDKISEDTGQCFFADLPSFVSLVMASGKQKYSEVARFCQVQKLCE